MCLSSSHPLHVFATFKVCSPPANLSADQLRPRRLARPRTSPFHGGNTGSNPVGDAKPTKHFLYSRGSPMRAADLILIKLACFACTMAYFACRNKRRASKIKCMHNAKAYSAASATSLLASTTIARRDPTEHDVQIEILYCGICHSDLHQVRN